jgi:hypothetical protein
VSRWGISVGRFPGKRQWLVKDSVMTNNPYNSFRRDGDAQQPQTEMFKDLDATELYCSHCKMAVPVRKRLLLVLPEGDKYEYFCPYCAETVGTKIDRQQQPSSLIV